MLYLQKDTTNTLALNINNNARPDFATYDLEFTHIMSKEVKVFTIDTNDPLVYSANTRYCTVTIVNCDLNYLGEYDVNIYGDGTQLVYVTMAVLEGSQENKPFTEYISPNEVNENYIYVQE